MSFEGRPRSSRGGPTTAQLLPNAPDPSSFDPHVFDFIALATESKNLQPTAYIPPIYLEAHSVDTARPLGEGFSFSASLRRLPDESSKNLDLNTIPKTFRATSLPTPRYIVYKTAKVQFEDSGKPVARHRKAFLSALTEFRALTHPPLFSHPNIIDFLGLAWGSNPFNPIHRLPVLVVEYAEHGTLSALLARQTLPPILKRSLSLDVALGLRALHDCGIVHGDIKTENVLIFSHDVKTYVAKLADFGFSVIETSEEERRLPGFTPPWEAPEAHSKIPMDQLKSTDLYSFGLLVWVVALDGNSPFKVCMNDQDIKTLKETDAVLQFSKLSKWMPTWLGSLPSFDLLKVVDLTISEFVQQDAQTQQHHGSELIDVARLTISELVGRDIQIPPSDNSLGHKLISAFVDVMQRSVFYRQLDSLFEKTLIHDPRRRCLDFAIEQLVLPNDSLSWQTMRDLEPSVQAFIFKQCQKMASDEGLPSNPFYKFVLGAYYVNGYGKTANPGAALRSIGRSACAYPLSTFNIHSRAYVHRLHETFGKLPSNRNDVVALLSELALRGSRAALQDLATVDPAQFTEIKSQLQSYFAGIGAPFYTDSNMLHNRNYGWYVNNFSKFLIDHGHELSTFEINRRGDRILHFLAATGMVARLSDVITNHAVDVNQTNPAGETPLLCACRSGHADVARLLLQYGASPAAAHNGETPLHWAVSLEDSDVSELASELIRKGADPNCFTKTRVAHSVFPGTIDADYQAPGTPLNWAVHWDKPKVVQELLKHGARPGIALGDSWFAPLDWAAFMHRNECLRLMLVGKPTLSNRDFVRLMSWAGLSCDTFSMILRDGPRYKEKMQATIDVILEQRRGLGFSDSYSYLFGFKRCLLYEAVSRAQDELVEYMLTQRLGFTDINEAEPTNGSTPLLESVRRNRRTLFQMLMLHGADLHKYGKHRFTKAPDSWTPLHELALAGHNDDPSLAEDIIGSGVPVDGRPKELLEIETPLYLAIQHNAFALADVLLKRGADVNAISLRSTFFVVEFPMTILGHLIASNSRYTEDRLRYLFRQGNTPQFIVEPTRRLTALHRAAWAHHGIRLDNGDHVTAGDFDMDTNRNILCALLEHFGSGGYLDARSAIAGRTAIHLAVESENVRAVDELLKAGADPTLLDENDISPLSLAQHMVQNALAGSRSCDELQEISDLLCEKLEVAMDRAG